MIGGPGGGGRSRRRTRLGLFSFLSSSLREAVRVSADGAVHFVCIDWRHLPELFEAGDGAYGAMLNLVAW